MRQFVADASHELRTPLTSVRGFAELYRLGAVAPGTALDDAMGRIESEAHRMGLLVEDLLLLARLDEHRPLDREPVNLLDLAGDAAAAARATAPGRDVVVEVGPDAPEARAVGDAARLRQVIDNLLSNALRYSPADEPVRLRVGVVEDSAGRWAQLEVTDRGPGMDPEEAARAFERFYRADPARSRTDGGAGLGLAIVAAITSAHGGRRGCADPTGRRRDLHGAAAAGRRPKEQRHQHPRHDHGSPQSIRRDPHPVPVLRSDPHHAGAPVRHGGLRLNCSACGAENAASNKFCGSCGAALAVTCASCGTPAAPGQRFCGGCGTPLASGAQTPTVGPPTSPSGAASAADVPGAPIAGREMRQVSVLFADLESFTTLRRGARCRGCP